MEPKPERPGDEESPNCSTLPPSNPRKENDGGNLRWKLGGGKRKDTNPKSLWN